MNGRTVNGDAIQEIELKNGHIILEEFDELGDLHIATSHHIRRI